MKKKRPVKKTWHYLITTYISKTLRKIVGGFKDKVVILFKTNTPWLKKEKQTKGIW